MTANLVRKPLRKLFSWLFLAIIIIAFSQFLFTVILVKLCPPEFVGRFALANAVTIPIFALTSLELSTIQVTDAADQYEFEDYLNLRIVSSGFALLLSIIIPIFAGYTRETLVIIWLVGLLKTIESVSNILYGVIQKSERMKTLAFLGGSKSLLSLGIVGVVLYLTRDLVLALILLILLRIVYLIIYEIPYSLSTPNPLMIDLKTNSQINLQFDPQVDPNRSISKSINWSKLFKAKWHSPKTFDLAKQALPLGIVTLLISFNANVPRYLIEHYTGDVALGVFATIAGLMMIGDMVLNPLGASAIPRMSQYYAEGNLKSFWQILIKLVAIALVIGGIVIAGCLLVGRQFLETVYRPEYGRYAQLLILLMLTGSIEDISSFLGQAITATRSFRIKMVISATVVTFSAAICFWLIPSQGLQGAAIALLIASVIDLGLNLIAIIYIMSQRLKALRALKA